MNFTAQLYSCPQWSWSLKVQNTFKTEQMTSIHTLKDHPLVYFSVHSTGFHNSEICWTGKIIGFQVDAQQINELINEKFYPPVRLIKFQLS